MKMTTKTIVGVIIDEEESLTSEPLVELLESMVLILTFKNVKHPVAITVTQDKKIRDLILAKLSNETNKEEGISDAG